MLAYVIECFRFNPHPSKLLLYLSTTKEGVQSSLYSGYFVADILAPLPLLDL